MLAFKSHWMKKYIILVSLVFAGCFGGEDPVVEDDLVEEETVSLMCQDLTVERLDFLNKYCSQGLSLEGCECFWSNVDNVTEDWKWVNTGVDRDFYYYSNSDDFSYYFDKESGIIKRYP